jgi:hypothetical protein
MPGDTNLSGSYVATVDLSGAAIITVTPTHNVPWLIYQVSAAQMSAPSGAAAVMRKNGAFVTYFVPTGDAAGGDPPVLLGPGDRLTLEWTLCTPGDVASALIFYDRIPYRR